MNKKQFLDKIHCEDKALLSNIYDKILLHDRTGNPIYINEFYTPNVWKSVLKISGGLGCKISTYGVFEECDRAMISILSQNEDHNIELYPLDLVRITNKSSFVKLKHSDFLGALMAQGLKREKFGDLILQEQECYLPICRDVSRFVCDNLIKIGKNPCETAIIDIESAKVAGKNFEKRNIVVSSMRIDSIVAGICGISRNSSADMIKKGLVLLDYEKILEKDAIVEAGVIITVRGYGKFKIHEFLGKTQKDREKITIKKYI